MRKVTLPEDMLIKAYLNYYYFTNVYLNYISIIDHGLQEIVKSRILKKSNNY